MNIKTVIIIIYSISLICIINLFNCTNYDNNDNNKKASTPIKIAPQILTNVSNGNIVAEIAQALKYDSPDSPYYINVSNTISDNNSNKDILFILYKQFDIMIKLTPNMYTEKHNKETYKDTINIDFKIITDKAFQPYIDYINADKVDLLREVLIRNYLKILQTIYNKKQKHYDKIYFMLLSDDYSDNKNIKALIYYSTFQRLIKYLNISNLEYKEFSEIENIIKSINCNIDMKIQDNNIIATNKKFLNGEGNYASDKKLTMKYILNIIPHEFNDDFSISIK